MTPKITQHPILDIPEREKITFRFNGQSIEAEKGQTIAAALHQAGHPVHSHSLKNRERSLECGIGKCGACEMLVDGEIRRICITRVDGVQEVSEIPKDHRPAPKPMDTHKGNEVYETDVAIIGAGPAGLAAREELQKQGIRTLVIDNNDKIGGQFTMQTHQFFFFEQEKHYGGMRGFDIAEKLAGEEQQDIFLNSTVWDILEGKMLAIKNLQTETVYYVRAQALVVATGAIPFMPVFENDDLPGVYTAAVVQKMMNNELTLLGKNVLTVGAGNIGYLTSYQLMQAGANVKAIIEAQPQEGGFPVQASRVRRLGIPILTSHLLLKAIPNADHTAVRGAVVAGARNFKPVPGTGRVLDGIDAINICTGLVPDDALLRKGHEIFGRFCHGVGDAVRIGEGTSAVLRGRQAAFEVLEQMEKRYSYPEYLKVSKAYIDSQQEPDRVLDQPVIPDYSSRKLPFVVVDCLYGFACNPCAFSCPQGAITKQSSSAVPVVDYEKCIGCMDCVHQCPGLAIFGYHPKKNWVFLPVEFAAEKGTEVYLVDNDGKAIGEGIIEKVMKKPNKTDILRVKAISLETTRLTDVRGSIAKTAYPEKIKLKENTESIDSQEYICHCDDVTLDEVMRVIGTRKFISVDEIKHTTRLGMGACRGKRCVKRLKQRLRDKDIQIVGEPTPRGPMSNQVRMGELFPKAVKDEVITHFNGTSRKKVKVAALIAGGGIAGSAAFRYLAEAGQKPVLVNSGHGSSWRNIAGGRPAFSLPEIADIARQNLQIFKDLQERGNIDFRTIRYVTLAHDTEMFEKLRASMDWQDARLIDRKDFTKEISPYAGKRMGEIYQAALVSNDCWQSTPGRVLDLIRAIGEEHGGKVEEDCRLMGLKKSGGTYHAVVRNHTGEYIEYETPMFINALGDEGDRFARMVDVETGLFPVKHQAFITRRLPYLGVNNRPLDMVIDRRDYKGFVAVYGQQLAETGQIIGCASPKIEPRETDKNLKINSKEFLEIATEVFVNWIPELSSVGFQAVWSGYYVEPRMIVDAEQGLLLGLRGQGYMLGQYLAKMLVDKLMGQSVPGYFQRLSLQGDGLLEKAFK